MADPAEHSESEGSELAQERKAGKRDPIPDSVDHFLGTMNDYIQCRNVHGTNQLYETTFNKLTEQHYKNSKWPSPYSVAEALGIEDSKNSLFVILYRDLYFRHIYSKLSVTYEDRKGSWENYVKLLELFVDDLSKGETLSVGLPIQWLWDILDEFVYHYQTYCNFRNKTIKSQKDSDVAKLKANPDVFDTCKVLSLLHQLVKNSLVEDWLTDKTNPKNLGGAFKDELVRYTGYFSMLQLLRLHCLLGDYRLALKTIACMDFTAEVPIFYTIPTCHITLFYYMGFAYLMMRRYQDAINTFSKILVFLSKAQGVNEWSYQFSFLMKKQDQMYVLLLLCVALSPQPLEDSLEKKIKENHAEKQARLGRGEEGCFDELFSYACPKFVSAAPPDFDNFESFMANEAHNRQLHLFLKDVKSQQALPKIGAYMKLYTSLKSSKLAQLCEMDEDGLRDQLMCVIHKTRQQVHSTGAPLDGTVQPCCEVEFYMDGDIIHINAHKPTRPHAEVFLEHILKFQDILGKMRK
eukprot:TRINITY_DN5165_c0_g2_i1.p2 TRINITY_DN5165_c0_g2~~TRINITY_DN5165_c0_g2_i1.p2  ORF type:complete len:520 (-),score=176.30 TRINITY_DN5165_c0_g2_i1:305-1864(-)